MKKLVITLIIICSFSLKAQESKITGNWQLTKVEVNNEIETDVKVVFIFSEKGVLKAARDTESRTIDAGSWKYNKKEKTIVMKSDLDKDFNGDAVVIKINDKELVYKKEGAIWTFSKLAKLNSPAKI
ncbi:lipocalin family protein [Lutibacter sp.]|uniref:lipocalin family protein n=1 Tax=Lutibacter sp. TaxID=1925666 RepID=UPI0034A06DE4